MSIRDKVPAFLLGKDQLVGTVTFSAFFSLVFLLCSIPFSSNAWFELGSAQSFGYTVSFFLLSLAVVIISKRQMYNMRFSADFTMLQYVLWNLGEIVMVSLMYTFFTITGADYGIIKIDNPQFVEIFFPSVVYVLVSLGVPCGLAGQYFAINEKNNTIRLMNMRNVVGDINPNPREDQRITLYDNSGVLKFSTTLSNLYYIVSDDNYIQVWFRDRTGEVKQYMLRCKLKTVEESFSGSSLIRCHRKYIVNMERVLTLKAEKEGYFIELDADALDPIPVSRTYEEAVLSRFNSR